MMNDGLNFHVGNYREACAMVEQFHYSRRIPSNVQLVGTFHTEGGLFGDSGDAVGAVFFSIPPTRWAEPVWELSRLVRGNSQIPLSSLVSKACRVAQAKGADLLVSFADAQQGHHGGIYQACSWNYHGQRERAMDGVLIDGVFVPGRSCNSKFGTRSPKKLTNILGKTVLPHYDEGKHLYWRALSKAGKRKSKRLGLNAAPYPKPNVADEKSEGPDFHRGLATAVGSG